MISLLLKHSQQTFALFFSPLWKEEFKCKQKQNKNSKTLSLSLSLECTLSNGGEREEKERKKVVLFLFLFLMGSEKLCGKKRVVKERSCLVVGVCLYSTAAPERQMPKQHIKEEKKFEIF